MGQVDLRVSYSRAMRVVDELDELEPTRVARQRRALGSTPPPFALVELGPDEQTLVQRLPQTRPAHDRIDTRTWAQELTAESDAGLDAALSAAIEELVLEAASPVVAPPPVPVPEAPMAAAVGEAAPRLVSETATVAAAPRRARMILRFVAAERMLHWALAIPFMVCLLTAAALIFVFNPNPALPHRDVVSWIHRISGACFIGLPIGVLLASPRYFGVFWENIKEGWLWTRRDIAWIALKPLTLISKRIELPEEGKFNAGEKLNFMWTMASWPLYGATGIAIWLGGAFGEYGVYPWLIHCGLVLISLPLLFGHLFMAVVNPSTRKGLSGMFSGWVDREWAKHHYRAWFKQKFGRARTEDNERVQRSSRARTVSTFIEVGRAVSPSVVAFAVLAGLGTVGAGAYLVVPSDGASTHGRAHGYLGADSPLYSAADEGAACVRGGPVVRGARVEPLREDGDFAYVRDQRGRTGYVFAADLFAERPRFQLSSFGPEACSWADGESDGTTCRQRADDKLELCRLECAGGHAEACRRRCAEAHGVCTASCETAPASDDERE